MFNTTADPSETKDLSAEPAFAAELRRQMLKETGEVCVGGLNDSCAVAIKTGTVEPCGFVPA